MREQDVLMEEHSGGCVLFERKETVETIPTKNTVEAERLSAGVTA